MSFTERSQILVPIRLQAQSEVMMSGLSSCKRKGLSLSKQLKARQQERPQSFIKLSARTKQPTMIQKREIKLILRPRTDQEDKENDTRQVNRDHRKEEKERRNLDHLLPHRSSNTRTSKRTDVLRLVLR